jgi:acyl-ACP thioesterase
MEHKVAYSDIDFNCHMNTMRYIGLMLDMVDIEQFKSNRPMRIDVHFIAECLYGQIIKVGLQNIDDQTLFEITRDDGVVACRGAISWR